METIVGRLKLLAPDGLLQRSDNQGRYLGEQVSLAVEKVKHLGGGVHAVGDSDHGSGLHHRKTRNDISNDEQYSARRRKRGK